MEDLSVSEPETNRETEWESLRAAHLRPSDLRPPSSGRGLHHVALISTDVEKTVSFYQDMVGFPLTELFENRDYLNSTHFFFDIGNGNSLAFFDFPGLDLGPYAEVIGGLHHIAISVEREHWERVRSAFQDAGHDYHVESESSLYFTGPDGERVELISDPLGELYGVKVGHE